MRTSTRRSFLGGAATGAAALVALRDPTAFAGPKVPVAGGGTFAQGVASGQPAPNGITLWSKVDGLERAGRVTFEVSPDADFRRVVHRGEALADPANGFAVHHRVQSAKALAPGQPYFYRCATRTASSPVGRFRTTRPADSREPVRIGFFSCQAFEAGFYTPHTGLAAEDLDLVVCLGDYVYERSFYGDEGVRADTTGANGDAEVQTLGEYRDKYALYHSDPRLLELRRRFPIMAIWDDHEVEDNYARELAGDATLDRRIPFLQRRANGYRAWFEHMPRIRVTGEPDRIYGRLPLGANAEVFLLDQRQYRDDQPCGDEFFVPCDESEAPGRTFLGSEQLAWLKSGLSSSRATWKVVGNQAMVMALDGPPRNEINKDQWDGYAAERADLVRSLPAGTTFVTGDIHTFFAGNVTETGRQGLPTDPPARATEFVGGAVTSEGILPATGQEASGLLLDANIVANNPHIRFSDSRYRGYGVLEATPDELRVRYRAARTVKAATSDVFDLAEFRVGRQTPGRVEVVRTAGGVTAPA
jgi:alkaline phosphatase D